MKDLILFSVITKSWDIQEKVCIRVKNFDAKWSESFVTNPVEVFVTHKFRFLFVQLRDN
jgi:hypothetical protein